MPPKVKITKEDILKTALELVRKSGADSLNARAIASSLNCSTQPIFSNFSTMDSLQSEVIIAAYELYSDFLKNEAESGKYPQYKAYGLAYIRFAKEEKELFKLLFMRDRSAEVISATPDFNESVELIAKNNNISHEMATLIHIEIWIFVHGIGTMLATSFLNFEWDMISRMLSDAYQGILAKHIPKEKSDECNKN